MTPLTLDEINALMLVIDAGIRAGGLQIFQDDGGHKLQNAFAKLQAMADAANAAKTGTAAAGPMTSEEKAARS